MKDPAYDTHIVWSDLDIPSMLVKDSLCFALSRFIMEVQKKNDKDYPPNSLCEMLFCIQAYLMTDKMYWKLIDESDPKFMDLAMVLDNNMKE